MQMGDGLLGLENSINPEAHQVRFWQCHGHMTPEGRLSEEFRHKHTKAPAAVEQLNNEIGVKGGI
jgi:hypothetical protein